MIILSWNIRGIGARIKRRLLRKLLHTHEPWLTFIQESKLELFSPKLARSINIWGDSEHCISPSVGNSGALISLWRSSCFQLLSSHSNRNWIALSGTLLSANFQWTLVNIYNSCDSSERATTWGEVTDFCNSSHFPCLIAGDFNEIILKEDRGSHQIDFASSTLFKDFINNLQLVEISPGEGWFTWFRGTSMSKLDRFFVQLEWLTTFPHLTTSILKRSVSDHCPIIIKAQNIDWGPKPFRFQNVWLTHHGCMELIKSSWLKSMGMTFLEKLKVMKADLKTWNSQDFGNIDSRISQFES